MASSTGGACRHRLVLTTSSSYAQSVGFQLKTSEQLRTAAGIGKGGSLNDRDFARPLILPGDDLADDPKYPAQSFRSWKRLSHRNNLLGSRRVVYIAAPPVISKEVSEMNGWTSPLGAHHSSSGTSGASLPGVADVADYLAAFYHGLPVKELPQSEVPLSFQLWREDLLERGKSKQKNEPLKYVGLANGTESVRIRVRPCPDGAFSYQLNLDDVLEVVMSSLPTDAFALVLIVQQDLYEDEDDDFCCGRAYGGSRCAVVSTARYLPQYQQSSMHERDIWHRWPASHCKEYVESNLNPNSGSLAHPKSRMAEGPKQRSQGIIELTSASPSEAYKSSDETFDGLPLDEAVRAHNDAKHTDGVTDWLFDVCRTASHELGHCFGIDHCVYYACAMQGTASMAEDGRQPPYICPVDLRKLNQAVREHHAVNDELWARERDEALLAVCEKYALARQTPSWTAFAAWLRARLRNANYLPHSS